MVRGVRRGGGTKTDLFFREGAGIRTKSVTDTRATTDKKLGLPCWTMIQAICVVVDESKCRDIPIWEFSIIWVHLPFLPGYKQILRQLLVLDVISMTFTAGNRF